MFNENQGYSLYCKVKQLNLGTANTDLYTCMAALNALYESFMIQNNFMDFEKISIQ